MQAMIFGGPGRYVQGPDVVTCFDEYARGMGKRPLILTDGILADALREALSASLSRLGAEPHFEVFEGECTAAAISTLSDAGRLHRADMVVGAGGGKTIDTAKGARIELDVPLVIIPTIASNDSPTSRLVVVYDENHRLVGTRTMRQSPELVLVDTQLIARAPVRFLRAGIGDAVSKRFEAEQAIAAGGRNFFGGRSGQIALAISRHCYQTIREDAEAGLAAAERQEPDAAFERLVEACVLGSGIGFESGGLSVAHAMLRGFSQVPSLSKSLHGEQVAVGLLIQLQADAAPGIDVLDLRRFYDRIGLPSTLLALGLTEPLESVAPMIVECVLRTAPYIGNFRSVLTQQHLLASLMLAAG